MVDRYSLTALSPALAERFSVEVPDHYKPRYNAAPSQLLPVITSSGRQGLSWFYWGRPPQFARNKNLGEKIINLSIETLKEKPVLKKALIQHRCIIPADGFYAWKKVGKKISIPHRISVADQKLFSIAGLWEEFEDEDSTMVHTFTIITTPSNKAILSITERMPVIFDKTTEDVWLNTKTPESELITILRTYASEKMSLYTVSPRINNPTNDHPSLIIPAPASDQYGNLTLFD
jgi:putative SOS response-associated peptidase YedK